MKHKFSLLIVLGSILGLVTLTGLVRTDSAQALTQKSGSAGIQGVIPSAPPTQAATITNPSNGQVFTSVPITVNGLCPKGLLVKIFSNNIFVGAVQCVNGSYSIQIDLFSAQNDLVARVYDALDQAGPDSNTVSVIFNDAQFRTFGSRVILSSSYARKGANPGDTLDWPIVLSGGSGPYALSIDWGDGKPAELRSVPFVGTLNFSHIYDSAGTYRVVVKATDINGTTGYLQLVGVGNGASSQDAGRGDGNITITKEKIIWWPVIVVIPLIVIAFWLGRRYELSALRRRIERLSQTTDTDPMA